MSPQLHQAIEKAIELAERGDPWTNFAVSTDYDEGLHLVVENGEVRRCRMWIGGDSRDFTHPRQALGAA
jgi:hypothetical protein